MTQEEIREIILNHHHNGEEITPEEMSIALEYFTAEEVMCMRFPQIDHTCCFNKRPVEYDDHMISTVEPPK